MVCAAHLTSPADWRDNVHHEGELEVHQSLDMRLLALATTVVVMAIFMLLLCTSDRKA